MIADYYIQDSTMEYFTAIYYELIVYEKDYFDIHAGSGVTEVSSLYLTPLYLMCMCNVFVQMLLWSKHFKLYYSRRILTLLIHSCPFVLASPVNEATTSCLGITILVAINYIVVKLPLIGCILYAGHLPFIIYQLKGYSYECCGVIDCIYKWSSDFANFWFAPTLPDMKWLTVRLHNLGITGKGVTIAFLDSGINVEHDAFTGRIKVMKDIRPHTNVNLLIDDSQHSAVSAFIACGASFNGTGPNGGHVTVPAGVAPEANIVMYKMDICSGEAYSGMITKGLEQCFEDKERYGIDIVVLPYGTKHYDANHSAVMQKLLSKRVLIVTASGNYGNSSDMPYPARLGHSICVGAHDQHGRITHNTCIGPALDFTAPESSVKHSLVHLAMFANESLMDTPCAAASVAGLVALIIQHIKDAAVTAEQFRGCHPSVDQLVHDQNVIKKLLTNISDTRSNDGYYCLKTISMLSNGDRLLELLYDGVHTTRHESIVKF